jgi:hypothetical protein
MTATAPSKRAGRQGGRREGRTNSQRHKSHEFSANLPAMANPIDKIRNSRYELPLTKSLSRSPIDGREDEKPRLFETLAHNLLREPARRSDF